MPHETVHTPEEQLVARLRRIMRLSPHIMWRDLEHRTQLSQKTLHTVMRRHGVPLPAKRIAEGATLAKLRELQPERVPFNPHGDYGRGQ